MKGPNVLLFDLSWRENQVEVDVGADGQHPGRFPTCRHSRPADGVMATFTGDI